MRFEILNEQGEVINTIVADLAFVESAFPGAYREVVDNQAIAERKREIIEAVQQRLDSFAATRNYSGMLSLCTYATSTNAKFSAEGQYGVDARDATWATCYQILAEVEAGTRPVPAGYADIESELPALAWPE